jgi:hypothetical protein
MYPPPTVLLRLGPVVGGTATGSSHRVGTVPIQLAGWRIGATVVRPEQNFAEVERILRCANGETKRYFSFTFRLPSLLAWRPFAAHTSDLMRAHYQQSAKPERENSDEQNNGHPSSTP